MTIMRSTFYANILTDKSKLTYSGISFYEFIRNTGENINHLLMLNNSYSGKNFHLPSRFGYVTQEEIPDLIKSDEFEYGDFCWVDFGCEDMLDRLTPAEIAEMLYFAHFGKPLKTPFWESIRNRYAYWSHDDGWYGELYCKKTDDLKNIMIKTILSKIEFFANSRIMLLPEGLQNKLFNLLIGGVLIDFNKLTVESGDIKLPIYIVGLISDFDEMLNDLANHLANAIDQAELHFISQK